MPSFKPARDYLLKLTGELIDRHAVSGPFLEVGCGDGAVSADLALRGWAGIALDKSDAAVQATGQRLLQTGATDRVRVMKGDFLDAALADRIGVVLAYDVLEHVADDRAFLRKVRALLRDSGHLLLSVPVKRREWRWDDEQYGHLRRYEFDELQALLGSAHLEMVAQWDITFPVMWLMRRVYLALARPGTRRAGSQEERTEESAFENAGRRSAVVRLVESLPIWTFVFWLQDRFRRRALGCNTLILARAV